MCRRGFNRLRLSASAGVGVLLLITLAAQGHQTEPEFVIRSWDRREGLPPTVINNIQRAQDGYLWLATQRGLVRFDGERFTLFDTNRQPEFRTNRLNCVLVHPSERVWFGSCAGLFHQANRTPGAGKWVEIGSSLSVKA